MHQQAKLIIQGVQSVKKAHTPFPPLATHVDYAAEPQHARAKHDYEQS